MRLPRAIRQKRLFEESPAKTPAVRLPQEIQEQLKEALVRWMQAVAKMINQEDGNEQNYR